MTPIAEAGSRPNRSAQIGAACLILQAQFLAAQFIAQAAARNYDLRTDDISFLGVTHCGPTLDPMSGTMIEACSPLHSVLNGGLALLGVLTIIGLYLTRATWRRGRPPWVGLALLALGGLGAIVSGLSPLDVAPARHGLGALLFFVPGLLGLIVTAFSIRRSRPLLALVGGLCGFASFVGFALYASGSGLPRGVAERVAGWPSTLWFVLAGAIFLVEARRSHAGSA